MSRKKPKHATRKGPSLHHTTIKEHYRQGKKLIPPLATLPNMQPQSWPNSRLPEMLWAALLVSQLPRPEALGVFRGLANHIYKHKDTSCPHDITHTGISNLSPDASGDLIRVLALTDDLRHALRPLLLLRDLPAREKWEGILGREPSVDAWKALTTAVAKTLGHQSQESTDCRWLRVMCMMAAGKLSLPDEEMVKGFVYYPEYGDMREVRPYIRSIELTIDQVLDIRERAWPSKFWAQCLSDTPCFPLPAGSDTAPPRVGTTSQRIGEVYAALIQHWNLTTTTTAVDAKHDAAFGYAFYCLSLLQELLRVGVSQSITARMALRAIVESFITLAYLAEKDDKDLWMSYRVFGAGQAKLQYLKLEALNETTSYVTSEALKQLANEDIWEEYLPIDLGHWSQADLRRLSEEARVKEDYDSFYGWTSSFAHGQWGALRSAVYDTCANPLHRLHRIPRTSARALPDVVPDACKLTDKVLDVLSRCYPDFPHRITIGA
jgi:hypothetical protein